MSTTTDVLSLFKYDPVADADSTFNITQALNNNWDKLDAAILLAIAAAAAYDPEGSYAVGDYCTYKGKLHKCSTAIPTGETWTEAHWTTTTVAAELAELSSQLSNLNTLVGGATTPQGALANLGAGVRPNLLDNWYFVGGGTQGKFPINQKGVTSSDDVAKYIIFIDRWRRSGADNHTMTLSDAGITTNGTANCQMYQLQEVDDFLGRTVTFSLFTSAGLFSGAVEIPASMPASNQTLYAYNDGNVALAILLLSANNLLQFQPMANSVMTFYAVKAEIGDTQTLCYQDEDGNWHLLPQPESDYATQLAKCQRYFRSFNAWTKFEADYIDANRVSFSIPGDMRIDPTVTGEWGVYTGFTLQNGFVLEGHRTGSNLVVVASKESHGLTTAWLGVKDNSFGYLNADL